MRKPILVNKKDKNGKEPHFQDRFYDIEGTMTSICTFSTPLILQKKSKNMENEKPKNQTKYKNPRIRRLTPTECARLQTIPDWYEFKYHDPKTGEVKPTSDTQIYKVLGNGWTVDVIKHIFSFLPCLQKA